MIRRKLRQILGLTSPARQLELELEADAEAYRRRLVAVCDGAGVELLPWQADFAVQQYRRRLQLRNEMGNDA